MPKIIKMTLPFDDILTEHICQVKPLRRYSIKKIDEHVGVEYQKNALYALLRRFKACLGIKPFGTYQINFKRIIVASDDKKEAS